MLNTWPPVKSSLGVPLLDPDLKPGDPHRVLGVLNVESPNKLDFTDRDIPILEQLAQLAVVAMRNREVYRGKARLLRDVTHAFKKALYPLRGSAFRLRSYVDPTSLVPLDDDATEADASLAPVRAIRAWAETVPEAVVLTSRSIVTSVDLAADLLGWFQALVAAQETRTKPDLAPTDLKVAVTKIVTSMQPLAASRGKQVIADIRTEADTTALCSENLMRAALFLLIDNALSYGPPEDTVVVRLGNGDAGYRVRIDVIDHGEPIPSAEWAFLFDEGFRGQAALSAHLLGRGTGSGIGLYHVRTIVETLHGGQVGYERSDDGNHFFVNLT